jgi:hypothetical protein
MKITDKNGKILHPGLPNMRQALFHAYNDPDCQSAEELHIMPETEPKVKGGKGGQEGNGENPAHPEK